MTNDESKFNEKMKSNYTQYDDKEENIELDETRKKTELIFLIKTNISSVLDDSILKCIDDVKLNIRKIYPQMNGGGKQSKKQSKKELLGKMRCIYKKKGDRKEYVKYKGVLITVKAYCEKMKSKKSTKKK